MKIFKKNCIFTNLFTLTNFKAYMTHKRVATHRLKTTVIDNKPNFLIILLF